MGKLGDLTDKIEHSLQDELNPLWRKVRKLRDDAKLLLVKQLLGDLPDAAWAEALVLLQAEMARRAGGQ